MMKKAFLIFIFLNSFGLFALENNSLGEFETYPLKLLDHKTFDFNPLNFKPLNNESYWSLNRFGKKEKIKGIYFDEEKKDYFLFSEDYLNFNSNLFISQNIHYKSANDLLKSAIGFVKGDPNLDMFTKYYPALKSQVFASEEELMESVKTGNTNVFVQSFPYALFYLKKYGLSDNFRQFRYVLDENEANHDNLFKPADLNAQTIHSPSLDFRFWLLAGFIFLLLLMAFFWFYRKRKRRRPEFELKNYDYTDFLRIGECDWIEFKSSLRYDFEKQQKNPQLELVIVKTLAAFLNSKGGVLLMGVDDQGKVIGLEHDYSTFSQKKNKDGFILKLSELIENNLGISAHHNINIQILAQGEKEFALLKIKPAPKPVFVRLSSQEEFFVRISARLKSLPPSEVYPYIKANWQ